jgi:hypothetical protein
MGGLRGKTFSSFLLGAGSDVKKQKKLPFPYGWAAGEGRYKTYYMRVG